MNLKNKNIWITGASSGIGAAVAIECSRRGANVILSARRKESLNDTAAKCSQSVRIEVIPLDISDYNSLTEITGGVIGKVKKVDILINNAGISQRSLAADTKFEVDKKMIDVNLLGTIALSKAILPHFVNNQSGFYVTISSLMGKFSSPYRSAYAAAKHGLHGFFNALRMELRDDNIGVMMVCPGFIRTDISKNALIGDGSKQNTMDNATDKGMSPERMAEKLCDALEKEKEEVYFGGKEVFAVYLNRLAPRFLRRLVSRSAVK